MKTMIIAAAAALSLITGGPAVAQQTPEAEADLRCFAAGLVLAGVTSEDKETANAASLLAFYFLGRLEGREPGVDWITKGIQLGNTEADTLLTVDLVRCGGELEAKGADMMTKGQAAAG